LAAVWNSHFNPPPASRAPQRIGFIAAVIAHVIAIAALLSYAPARQALVEAAPILVSLLSPPQPEKKIEPPKPKPVIKPQPLPVRPVEMPLVVAPAETPSPSPIVVAPPPPAPTAPSPISAPPEPVASPAPIAITQPIFNADYLDNPAPAYPPMSRRMREQGRVILRVLVNPAGRADDVQLRTSSGSGRLDDAARETVRRWRFVPAKQGSVAVPAWVLIPISFRLES